MPSGEAPRKPCIVTSDGSTPGLFRGMPSIRTAPPRTTPCSSIRTCRRAEAHRPRRDDTRLGWPVLGRIGTMVGRMRRRPLALGLVACLLAGTGVSTQGISQSDEYLVSRMLHDAHDAVKQNYYDLTFHGEDLEARYREYDDKLKSASSLNDGLTMVAGFLNGLKDSHTYFVPPRRPYKIDYGYRFAP